MKAQEYLEEKIKNCSKYELTSLDEKFLEENGIDKFIYKELTSGKFRKWSVDDSSIEKVKGAIKNSVDNNEPIKCTHPFGGYKLWRIPTSPEVDWAEFLMISYYCQYLSPILKAYKPGIEFIFSSDDLIIERMNNVPKEDTDAYFESFRVLLKEFSKYFPDNMKMEIRRVYDLYKDKKELESDLANNLKRFESEYRDKDEDQKEIAFKSSELNFNFNGKEDLTKLSAEEKKEKIRLGTILHDAHCKLPKRKSFVRGDDKIVIFTTKISNAIAIGTTKSSVTKFWTGLGVLEKGANGFKDIVLSPKQIEEIDIKQTKSEKIDLIPLKNFSEIKIKAK